MAKRHLNSIHILKSDQEVGKEMKFPKGQEFHIINEVLYMEGLLVPPALQHTLVSWIENNPKLFMLDTRHF